MVGLKTAWVRWCRVGDSVGDGMGNGTGEMAGQEMVQEMAQGRRWWGQGRK